MSRQIIVNSSGSRLRVVVRLAIASRVLLLLLLSVIIVVVVCSVAILTAPLSLAISLVVLIVVLLLLLLIISLVVVLLLIGAVVLLIRLNRFRLGHWLLLLGRATKVKARWLVHWLRLNSRGEEVLVVLRTNGSSGIQSLHDWTLRLG